MHRPPPEARSLGCVELDGSRGVISTGHPTTEVKYFKCEGDDTCAGEHVEGGSSPGFTVLKVTFHSKTEKGRQKVPLMKVCNTVNPKSRSAWK